MHFKGKILMDGGTIWNLNIDKAIEQCKAMGVTDHQKIIVDVAICDEEAEEHGKGFETSRRAHENWFNAFQLHRGYHNMNSLEW